MENQEDDYKETELNSEHKLLRKWENTDGSEWYTDLNCNFVGHDLQEALDNIKE